MFQFESRGMRDVLRRYQPNTIEDLTALNALYRPGPIQGGMIDYFIDRKHGRKKIEYELPELEEILEETFGVIVYQEHVMQIANRLAGYSLGEADLLRRAMGKKKPEEMAKQRERFVEGAVQRGYPPKKIEKIFDLLAKFAEYGFPKAHSAAYALLAYQTAYLKTRYPVEFMAALLTSVTGNTDDVVKYINECREMGIAVEAPDINVSDANFTPHGSAIRFGLAAVKNVGHNAIESIVAGRKELGRYSSIYEFCEKVDLRLLNKRVLESLIKSGAMDGLGRRAQLMAVLDRAIEGAQKTQRDAECGQHGLFGVFQQEEVSGAHNKLPDTPDWDEHTRLANEKEILGFFISGHPLEKYRDKLERPARALDGRDCRPYQIHRQGRKHHHRRHHHQPARAEIEARRFLRPGRARRHGRLGRDAGVPRGLSQAAGQSEAGSAGADPGRSAHRRRRESEADGERDSSVRRRQGALAEFAAHSRPARDRK